MESVVEPSFYSVILTVRKNAGVISVQRRRKVNFRKGSDRLHRFFEVKNAGHPEPYLCS
jgi:hypothetical protein